MMIPLCLSVKLSVTIWRNLMRVASKLAPRDAISFLSDFATKERVSEEGNWSDWLAATADTEADADDDDDEKEDGNGDVDGDGDGDGEEHNKAASKDTAVEKGSV